jgi:phosphohistidine phosphatase
MKLYIVRHGIAVDRGAPNIPDEERWLTDEGKEKTRLVAQGLRTLGVEVGVILTSPLIRARQTADILAKVLHPDGGVRETEHLEPGFSPTLLLRELGEMKDMAAVMIVGHEPDLSEFISQLVWGDEGGTVVMKKAGVALLTLSAVPPTDRSVTFKWLLPPKVLIALAKA